MSEAVIVEAVRSPGGRYRRGGLAATRGEEYGIQVMKGLLARVPQLKPEDVDDLIVGCSFPEAEQGMNLGRIIAMGAGLPITTSGMTINRFCSSGLQSIADATAKIRAGWSEVMIAGGCETMSHIPMGGSHFRPNPDWGNRPNVYVSMGITAENVAAKYNVSREDQDKFGVESNRRAFEAIKAGKFKEEIIPIQACKYKGLKRQAHPRESRLRYGRRRALADDGRRPGQTEIRLQGGRVRDGGQLLADDRRGCLRAAHDGGEGQGPGPQAPGQDDVFAVAGCEPEEMGIGPA